MVDFARETPIGVGSLAARFDVNPVTVRRWFTRGLEFGKIGGLVFTTLEAVNRFQRGGSPTVQAIVVDRETLAALKSLKSQGFKIGTENRTDGQQRKAST